MRIVKRFGRLTVEHVTGGTWRVRYRSREVGVITKDGATVRRFKPNRTGRKYSWPELKATGWGFLVLKLVEVSDRQK